MCGRKDLSSSPFLHSAVQPRQVNACSLAVKCNMLAGAQEDDTDDGNETPYPLGLPRSLRRTGGNAGSGEVNPETGGLASPKATSMAEVNPEEEAKDRILVRPSSLCGDCALPFILAVCVLPICWNTPAFMVCTCVSVLGGSRDERERERRGEEGGGRDVRTRRGTLGYWRTTTRVGGVCREHNGQNWMRFGTAWWQSLGTTSVRSGCRTCSNWHITRCCPERSACGAPPPVFWPCGHSALSQ
jgi:hypothetical protein